MKECFRSKSFLERNSQIVLGGRELSTSGSYRLVSEVGSSEGPTIGLMGSIRNGS